MKENNPRLLLARLRNGNFAHPGDKEAIDILIEHLKPHQQSSPLKILDVGCGRGGTADYMRQTIPDIVSITAIDMDIKAISTAQSLYVNINFKIIDIAEVDQKITDKFNLIYMFSVYYALPETLKHESLVKLAAIAEDETILAISDYVRLREDTEPLLDFAEKPMCPVLIDDLKCSLNETGWELLEEIDLSDKYVEWYRDFLDKMREKKIELLSEFTEESYNQVANTFTSILNKIETKTWGGTICYAKLKNRPTFFSSCSIKNNEVNGDFKINNIA